MREARPSIRIESRGFLKVNSDILGLPGLGSQLPSGKGNRKDKRQSQQA
jgi:hypothetical protein